MDQPGMKGREIDFIPDRLIAEPVVFRGLTDSEVVVLIIAGLAFGMPVSVLVLWPFGWGLFGVGIGLGLAILTLLVIGKYLQELKRRRPDGLHIVYLKKLAQKKFSFINYNYIESSQSWDIRRERPVVRAKTTMED
jgi:conjugative transfer region protein (TIGR03750 family)